MASANNYPIQYESLLTLKDGREIFLRPIKQTDEQLVIDLFNKLSTNSIYLRFLRHLHDIPQDMLYRFTHIDYINDFAIACVIKEDGKDAIIAVARYVNSPDDNLTELAISVRDDWQHFGIGKSLLKKIVDIGKEHGIYRFGGMIDPHNKIIWQILLELGYKVNSSLISGYYQVEIIV
jgi:RimJ/RimL family protein N-acetyltransferase